MASDRKEKRSFDKLRTSGSGRIVIDECVLEAVFAATRAAHPLEACGILLGDGAYVTVLVPTANIHPSPETHFEIDPQALVDAHRAEREGGAPIMGYFHSHPTGRPEPSETDRALAAHDGKVWAIATLSDIRFWKDDPAGFQPLSYEVAKR